MKSLAKRWLSKLGWRQDKKLLVFCSDDWGTVRIRSRQARNRLADLGIDTENNRFNRFDSLEKNDDLELLFEVLMKHRDHRGNHPVITAVTCTGNPDFERIEESRFEHYFWEPLPRSLERYANSDRVFQHYQSGIAENIFVPEPHGREHIQVDWWMKALRARNSLAGKVFAQEFFFLNKEQPDNSGRQALGAAFDFSSVAELENLRSIVAESIELFKQLFSYSPQYFTPPSLLYPQQLEGVLAEQGIKLLDVGFLRKAPVGQGKYKRTVNYLGRYAKGKLRYIIRNSVFEPNLSDHHDAVGNCLKGIEEAFKLRIPAIVSNHRAAFAGRIDPENRGRGLRSLDELLTAVVRKWPEVEFISAGELAKRMNE